MANDNPVEVSEKEQESGSQTDENQETKALETAKKVEEIAKRTESEEAEDDENEPDPYYPPIIFLKIISIGQSKKILTNFSVI